MMRTPAVSRAELEESMAAIPGRAFRDPSYTLIFLGFFSCGYQLGFITAHFPAMITKASAAIDPLGLLARLGLTTPSALGAPSVILHLPIRERRELAGGI